MFAQLIPILVSPLLTRIYSPHDFGTYVLFTAVSGVIAVAATGRYEISIILPKRHGIAALLVGLSQLIAAATSILVSLGIVVCSLWVTVGSYFDVWVRFVPLCIFVTGVQQSMLYWRNRLDDYRRMAKSRILQSIATAVTAVVLGWAGAGEKGLIVSGLVGQVLAVAYLLLVSRSLMASFRKCVSKRRLVFVAAKFSRFPCYSMPLGIVNSVSQNMFVYFLSMLFPVMVVGNYSLAQRTVGMPLGVLSSAFSSVFYQEINRSAEKTDFYVRSFLANLVIGAVLVWPLIFFSEELFVLVFGDEWLVAGQLAKQLLPLLIASFSVGTVSLVFSQLQKENVVLVWQLLYFVIFGFIMYLNSSDYMVAISMLSTFGAAMYMALFGIGYAMLRSDKQVGSA